MNLSVVSINWLMVCINHDVLVSGLVLQCKLFLYLLNIRCAFSIASILVSLETFSFRISSSSDSSSSNISVGSIWHDLLVSLLFLFPLVPGTDGNEGDDDVDVTIFFGRVGVMQLWSDGGEYDNVHVVSLLLCVCACLLVVLSEVIDG